MMTIEERMLLKEIKIVALKNIKYLLGNGRGIEDLPFQSPPVSDTPAVTTPPKAPTTPAAPKSEDKGNAVKKEFPDDIDQISIDEALNIAAAKAESKKAEAETQPPSQPTIEPPTSTTNDGNAAEALPYPFRSPRAWWRTEKRRRRYEDARIKKEAQNRCYGFEVIVKWCDDYERAHKKELDV